MIEKKASSVMSSCPLESSRLIILKPECLRVNYVRGSLRSHWGVPPQVVRKRILHKEKLRGRMRAFLQILLRAYCQAEGCVGKGRDVVVSEERSWNQCKNLQHPEAYREKQGGEGEGRTALGAGDNSMMTGWSSQGTEE